MKSSTQKGQTLIEFVIAIFVGILASGCFLEIFRLFCLHFVFYASIENSIRQLQELHHTAELWCTGSTDKDCQPCPSVLDGKCMAHPKLLKQIRISMKKFFLKLPTSHLMTQDGSLKPLPTDPETNLPAFPLHLSVWSEKNKDPEGVGYQQLRIRAIACFPTLLGSLLIPERNDGSSSSACEVKLNDATSPTGVRNGLGQFAKDVSLHSWKLTQEIAAPWSAAHFIFELGTPPPPDVAWSHTDLPNGFDDQIQNFQPQFFGDFLKTSEKSEQKRRTKQLNGGNKR